MEYWEGRADRLHNRMRYLRVDGRWQRDRLAPYPNFAGSIWIHTCSARPSSSPSRVYSAVAVWRLRPLLAISAPRTRHGSPIPGVRVTRAVIEPNTAGSSPTLAAQPPGQSSAAHAIGGLTWPVPSSKASWGVHVAAVEPLS